MTRTLDEVRLLRPAEAAAVLGVSVRQLARLVEAGRLQPVRLTENGNRRFCLRDLDALVNPTKETTARADSRNPSSSTSPNSSASTGARPPPTTCSGRARRERSYADAEDPTGILRLDAPLSQTRPTPATSAADAEIDGAVGSGAIPRGDRDEWRRRFERAPDTVREVHGSLPGDPALAERAFAEDTRLRSLADAFDSYMGVAPEDRVRAFEESDGESRDPTGLLRL